MLGAAKKEESNKLGVVIGAYRKHYASSETQFEVSTLSPNLISQIDKLKNPAAFVQSVARECVKSQNQENFFTLMPNDFGNELNLILMATAIYTKPGHCILHISVKE